MCRSNEEGQFIDVFQKDKFNVVEGRDQKKKVEILMKPASDTVYLLCKSEGRKNKEQAMRNSREKSWKKTWQIYSIRFKKGEKITLSKSNKELVASKSGSERYPNIMRSHTLIGNSHIHSLKVRIFPKEFQIL
jgi:hypothetical protein